jgi:hypothetical protein
MGQQQILLIVLTVILVFIALAVGMSMFRTQALLAHQDEIITGMNSLVADAVVYRMRSPSIGGGSGNTFQGFLPVGAVEVPNGTQPIMAGGSTGFKIERGNAFYWVELWAEGGYPQRIKITALSKRYGGVQDHIPTHSSNARMVAYYDINGNLINDGATRNGIMLNGNWPG